MSGTLHAATAADASLVEALRAAQDAGQVVLPCGRRSRIARHAPQARADHWLSLADRTELLQLDVEDQTVEVEAGCSPEALATALAPHGLELGVDAPCAASGTVGGLFLAPDLNLLHAVWGPPHDQVLGGSWMLADGTVVQTGARVVKSVAGYDVTRLFLGSRGRLAACLRLILRLRPLPRRRRCFLVERPEAWLGLPLAERTPVRRAFHAPGSSGWWVETDGLEAPPSCGGKEVDEQTFDAARAACLGAFAEAPRRIALHPTDQRLLWTGHGAPAADAGSGRLAWGEAELPQGEPWRAALGRACVVPETGESPWLARVQRACAPHATPFGSSPTSPRA